MDNDEPRGKYVNDMVEKVGVAGAVEGGVERKREEENVGDILQPLRGKQTTLYSGDDEPHTVY